MPLLLLGLLVVAGLFAMQGTSSAQPGGGATPGGGGPAPHPPGPGFGPLPHFSTTPGGPSGHDVAPIFVPPPGVQVAPTPTPGPVPPPSPPSPPLPAPVGARDGVVTTKTDPLRIRSAPSLSSSTLGLAPKGSHLRVDGDAVASSAADAHAGTPSWYPVTQLASGISGYAASEYVAVT